MRMIQWFNDAPVGISTRDDGTRVIFGYASVFWNPNDPGTEYQLGRDLRERIARDAFSRALNERQDVRGLFNHDSSQVLGRVANGTVKLMTDDRGLRYEITPPDTQVGRDVVALLERGDVTGSSFAFMPTKTAFEKGQEYNVRWIQDLTLLDVGPVTYPAYTSASSAVRSVSDPEIAQDYAAWKASQHDWLKRQKRLRQISLIEKGLTG